MRWAGPRKNRRRASVSAHRLASHGLGIQRGIAIEGSGNVYVTDIDSATIRVIHAVRRKTK
jgi:hypothetical protein